MVDAVELGVQFARVILPLVAVLVISRTAYNNYRAYVVYEDRHLSVGMWKDVGTRTTTKSRRSISKNASTTMMSATKLRRAVECSSVSDAVFVAVLHFGFSATCCFFDVALYWLLVVVGRHTAPPPFDFTGADSVNTVTNGEGAIVAVLAEFLTILHAGHWFGFTDAGYMCSVHPVAPDYVSLVVVVVLYVVLFVFITIQSRVLSWQNRIVAYFYPEQEHRRRQFFAALLTARRDRRLNTVDDDDAPLAAQKDVLRDLMYLGSTSWRLSTLLAVRRAPVPPVSEGGPRCVACGQPVSRRLRKARASTRHLSNDDCLDVEICPVCDCRLTPDDDVVFSNAAYCTSVDATSRVC